MKDSQMILKEPADFEQKDLGLYHSQLQVRFVLMGIRRCRMGVKSLYRFVGKRHK